MGTSQQVRPGVDTADLKRRRDALARSMPTWEVLSIDQRLERAVAAWPDRAYLVFGSDEYTYAQVQDRARRIATTFDKAGVGPGTYVGLLMLNSLDLYASMFAIAMLGGRSVPINYLLAPVELAHVVSHSGCSVFVVDPAVPGRGGVNLMEATFAALPDPSAAAHFSTFVVAPEQADIPSSFRFEPFVAADEPFDQPSRSRGEDISHIYYTSGSTALPKAVQESHDAMLREAYGIALTRAYDDGWRLINALPPFHIFGLLQAVFALMFVGGTAVIERTFDAERMLQQIDRLRVRDCISVPAMSQRLVEIARERSFDLSCLTALFTGGNAVPAASWREIQEVLGVVELGTGYGLTEAPGVVFMAPPEAPLEVLTETVGGPKMSGVAGISELGGRQHRVKIVDRNTGEPVVDGADGEILISGPTVTPGYLANDVENERCFHNGYLRTGDVGHIREDGNLVLVGRIKEMYKSGGENVTPKEVEAALYTHSAVEQAIVVGIPDPKWGETGCAWIVPVRGSNVTSDELIAHCKERLARYKVPRFVYLIEAADLPLTGVGKLKRQDLVDMAVQRAATDVTAPAQ